MHQTMYPSALIPFFLLALLLAASIDAKKHATGSLRLKLVHRNSHDSPFRKNFSSQQDFLADIVHGDSVRVQSLQTTLRHKIKHHLPKGLGFNSSSIWKQSTYYHKKDYTAPVISGASSGSGEYFVDFYIGTPPQKFMLVADTGSDLIWVRCSACRECHRKPGSAFLARHSSSFAPMHCYSPACRLVPHPPHSSCNRTRLHSTCKYDYVYADLSDSSGIFAHETATFNTSAGTNARIRNLAFGCGIRSSGPSLTGPSFSGANGVMGLSKGAISLTSQIGTRVGNKFSYCLVDRGF